MTKEEIFNDFIQKVKRDNFQIINVCRSNRDNVQSFSFEITDKQTATNIELANKLSKENAEIAGRMNRLDEFMDTEEYRHLSDKESAGEWTDANLHYLSQCFPKEAVEAMKEDAKDDAY